MNPNAQKYISLIVVILVVVLGVFLLKNKKANSPAPSPSIATPSVGSSIGPSPSAAIPGNTPSNTPGALTEEQQDLLAKLQKSADARDFESFASALEEVYKNQWSGIKEFTKAESDFYVYATDTYWAKGDLENSLKVSTIVYGKVPEAWRFRYLRIVSLEKYGRNAFNAGDLKTAENYANQILQMMYRPEGANLLADVYISKIKTDIKSGNTALAKQNIGFVRDFEVSQDRRDALNDLSKQLGL